MLIGSDRFCEELHKEMSVGGWRSAKSLAEKLNVNQYELEEWLMTYGSVSGRLSKDGTVLFSLNSRLIKMADEVESLDVEIKPLPPHTKIGSEEFCKILLKELNGNKIWRSSKSLAATLEVDPIDLDVWLRKQQTVCSKPSKDDGVVLYALNSRLEDNNKEEKTPSRPVVSEEDRYALASFNSALQILEAAVKKYAMRIHERCPEAFNKLVNAKSNLEGGLLLLATSQKADMDKLP